MFFILIASLVSSDLLVIKKSWGQESVRWGSLDVRAKNWAKVSINGLPSKYTPILIKKLRPGRYRLSWEKPGAKGEKTIVVKDSELVKLQL